MESSNGLTAHMEGLKHTETVEQEITRKGLSAPRVTPADIDSAVAREYYFTAWQAIAALGMPAVPNCPTDLLTVCVLVLENGFTVIGKSACASPENFNRELGQRIAKDDAKRQMWPLLGYALRDRLARG